jgi:hypothetical protein
VICYIEVPFKTGFSLTVVVWVWDFQQVVDISIALFIKGLQKYLSWLKLGRGVVFFNRCLMVPIFISFIDFYTVYRFYNLNFDYKKVLVDKQT